MSAGAVEHNNAMRPGRMAAERFLPAHCMHAVVDRASPDQSP